ncbi:MAG: hypothetical protein M3N07_07855 [Pseudomonadota bacterium]|nr:hypothetical protein [Pseudomonadota bacterium]
MNEAVLSGAVAAAFFLLHLGSSRLDFLAALPRSIWLSAAGGVSVAYVFVHLLPELALHQRSFRGAGPEGLLAALERHVYLVALAGLACFYGLERLARCSGRPRDMEARRWGDRVFWIHLGAFALYNLLVGYLLVHRDEQDIGGLLFFAVALGLHFVVNDQGLRQHHGRLYDRSGRWVLAAAPVLGWGLGLAFPVSPMLLAGLFAFLAGGIVLNVLKEELPEDRESRFWPFAAGAAAYAWLMLAAA